MSDDTSSPDVEEPKYDSSSFLLTDNDFLRFMDARFDSTECPQCRKDEGWTMDVLRRKPDCPLPSGVSYMRVYRMPNADNSKVFRPVIAMTCVACGSIRLIGADAVRDWIVENPEDATDD